MYHIIINPASMSGHSKKLWDKKFQPLFDERKLEYQVHFTLPDKDAGDIVRELIAKEETLPVRVFLLGGDGTLNNFINGIEDFDKVLVSYLPTGSSNDFARDLPIEKNLTKLCAHMLDNPTDIYSDIGKVTYRFDDGSEKSALFCVSCGIGFDAAVCEKALHAKTKGFLNKLGLGKLTYLNISLREIFKTKENRCELILDDTPTMGFPKFLFVVGMIHKYEGGGFKFCPNADSSDGLLDICAIGDASTYDFMTTLPAAFKGTHDKRDFVSLHRAESVTVKVKDPRFVHTDGEVAYSVGEIEMHCLSQKMHLME